MASMSSGHGILKLMIYSINHFNSKRKLQSCLQVTIPGPLDSDFNFSDFNLNKTATITTWNDLLKLINRPYECPCLMRLINTSFI
ncbi:hypothetical protein BpHYR1_002675 [Brachionus plicatilis]|uniref:Uncharacterized protein n=1 Tax=Brachionus plicatilis TaxID=10195 RepID=A0A3M7R7R1_BRAPC|nr:hypothetical protein BpHYR1_002675 [Brachionus plicatilis]